MEDEILVEHDGKGVQLLKGESARQHGKNRGLISTTQ